MPKRIDILECSCYFVLLGHGGVVFCVYVMVGQWYGEINSWVRLIVLHEFLRGDSACMFKTACLTYTCMQLGALQTRRSASLDAMQICADIRAQCNYARPNICKQPTFTIVAACVTQQW